MKGLAFFASSYLRILHHALYCIMVAKIERWCIMLSLGIRKVVVISLIGGIFLLGNVWFLVNWLQEAGMIDWAEGFRHTYLTPTAITVIVVLMVLLVRPRAEFARLIRHCPVCDHRILGKNNYCSDCGSRL